MNQDFEDDPWNFPKPAYDRVQPFNELVRKVKSEKKFRGMLLVTLVNSGIITETSCDVIHDCSIFQMVRHLTRYEFCMMFMHMQTLLSELSDFGKEHFGETEFNETLKATFEAVKIKELINPANNLPDPEYGEGGFQTNFFPNVPDKYNAITSDKDGFKVDQDILKKFYEDTVGKVEDDPTE